MCGRFGLWATPKQVVDHFQLQEPLPFALRYNIAPSQEVLAVGQTREGTRKAAWLRWGLVPHWAKDEKVGYKMINARAETMFTKPAYKSAAKRHRCLIPASCFFEWQRSYKGSKKQPYCIRPKDGGLFAFAGLWEHWQDEEAGKKIYSCTIITTRANEAVAELHDRMPVVIWKENFDLWLNRSVEDPEQLQPLLEPISELLLKPRNEHFVLDNVYLLTIVAYPNHH
ncbi:MAG: SOS response-associated peptidase [Bacteroidales bacterium]|nr:SOS response-associated peptidase [Bacteroidales bacterium]